MADLFGLLALFIIFGSIVAIFALLVYFDHKKNIAMIEKGLIPEEEKPRPEGKIWWGIALLGIGISLIATVMFNLNSYTVGGLIFASIGIALLVSYQISKQQQ
jgi:uncharacterized membrane protein